MSDKITCQLCGAQEHSIQLHLKAAHPEVSVDDYVKQFPDAPLMSEVAKAALAAKRAKMAAEKNTVADSAAPAEGGSKLEMSGTGTATVSTFVPKGQIVKKAFHEVFNLGKTKAAMSTKGDPIPITVITNTGNADMVPVVSDEYVYDVDELKNIILALELNIPCYVWGHKGSGKSELFKQIAARTGRPMLRVQHTVNTEESHIVGQWTVKNGQTVFELGPLPLAMLNGWFYLADEYDFALPSVLSVYQAILEGEPLVIKEAPAELRVIKPHSNFRFGATGNTNGSGDETGLYQGTSLQNSANYDRFGMVIHKQYMSKSEESQILQKRVGLVKEDADNMVNFAEKVREAYDGSKISDTISPRTLIYAAKIGVKRGSFRQGIQLSFINKLSRVDREVVDGLAQRIFG